MHPYVAQHVAQARNDDLNRQVRYAHIPRRQRRAAPKRADLTRAAATAARA